tara:strand:+ start:263 stop:514 length:252 start_codon:yes stop_codon:yes gene_type:complete
MFIKDKGISINPNCPDEYRDQIWDVIKNGEGEIDPKAEAWFEGHYTVVEPMVEPEPEPEPVQEEFEEGTVEEEPKPKSKKKKK